MKTKLHGGINPGGPIDEAVAIALIKRQNELCVGKLRGDFQDLVEWADPAQIHADSIGLLFHRDQLLAECIGIPQRGQPLPLPVKSYAETKLLRFEDFLYKESLLESPAGTGCLVSRDTLLTCDHVMDSMVIESMELGELFVVFGFHANRNEPKELEFGKHVFTVASVLDRGNGTGPKDWALLRLTSPVMGVRSIPKVASKPVIPGAPLYSLGHPNGLSLRYALSPTSSRDHQAGCYRAFLDGYEGASGSPVFNEKNEIAGLMSETPINSEGVVLTKAGGYLSLVCSEPFDVQGTRVTGSENLPAIPS